MFFCFDIKTFILPSILIGIFLFWRLKDVRKTIFFVLILTLPFERGIRGGEFTAVWSSLIFDRPGYTFYFGLSLKFVFGLTLFLLLFKDRLFLKNKIKILDKESCSLLGFLFFAILSVLKAQNFTIAILGLAEILFSVWLFFLARIFLKDKRNLRIFKNILVITLLFEGLIGVVQFLKGGVIGRFIESIARNVPFGWSTLENQQVFRATGTLGHPTFYGSLLSILISVVSVYLLKLVLVNKKKIFNFANLPILASIILGTTAVFFSFARSGWLATAMVVSILFWYLSRKFEIKVLFKKLSFLVMPILIIGVTFSSYLFIRIFSVRDFFTVGTGRGRVMLIKEAIAMIKQKPVLGVGLNNFTPTMIQNNVTTEAEKFVYPVHNTFLLFASEIGLPGTLFFVYFIIYILFKSFKQNSTWQGLGFWLACIAFIVNAQFHTLFSQDPSFEYFMLFLGILSNKIT